MLARTNQVNCWFKDSEFAGFGEDTPLKKGQDDVGIMILLLNIVLEESYKNVEHLKMTFTQLMLP